MNKIKLGIVNDEINTRGAYLKILDRHTALIKFFVKVQKLFCSNTINVFIKIMFLVKARINYTKLTCLIDLLA